MEDKTTTGERSEMAFIKEEIKDKKSLLLTTEEAEQYSLIVDRVVDARNQRESIREEFDDLCYEDDYWLNRRAMLSYLRPKINDDEVRVVTGVTEKKIEFVANELLDMNLQPQIFAYDQHDNEIQNVGKLLGDIVRRTNEMEQDEDRYVDAVLELLSQRAVFVEELWVDRKIRGNQRIQRPEKRILSGLQVYLGDISMPAWRLNDQPYLIKYERMTYLEGRQIYGDFDRWQYVMPGRYSSYSQSDSYLYRRNSIAKNEIEILHYFSNSDNEYQCIINGVPMYGVGEKLPWGYEGYNITMTVLKPISHDFAYGKPLTASAKTLQALDNETIRNLIRKFRQAIEPPTGTKAGKVFSRDIFSAGKITQGLTDKDFSRLIDHQGVTPGEMQFLSNIENKINEFVGTQAASPSRSGKPLATELMQAQKQAAKMLGFSILAVMRLKRNMTFLRLQNMLENYTKRIKKVNDPILKTMNEVYARFTISQSEVQGNKSGQQVVSLTNRGMSQDEQNQAFSFEEAQKKQGKNVAIHAINIDLLKKLKATYFVSVSERPRDSSELSKTLFNDRIQQAGLISQMTGRQVKANTVIDDYERVWDTKDMFEEAQQAPPPGQPGQPGQPQQGQPGQSPQAGQIQQQAMQKPTQQPSINQLNA